MDFVEKIEKIIEPSLTDMGYEIVRVQLQGAQRKTLQVMISHLDGQAVTINDCTQASHMISALLEVEDPMPEAYVLEVSSPGMERPLVKLRDFERLTDECIRFELQYPQEGRRRFQGFLKGVNKNKVLVELEGEDGVSEFEYADIQKARIIPGYE